MWEKIFRPQPALSGRASCVAVFVPCEEACYGSGRIPEKKGEKEIEKIICLRWKAC